MPLDNEILQRLRDNDPTLTSLDLYDYQIEAKGAQALAVGLEKNTTLTSLYLESNQISDAGAKSLGDALVHNTALTSLHLYSNQINDAGAKFIGDALVNNTTLTSLDLRRNQISDAGAKSLADALEKNVTLALLYLGGNQISDAVNKQIDSLIHRNQQYLQKIKAAACEQLKVGRVLLYKAKATEEGSSIVSRLPLKIREKIIKQVGKDASLMTKEQQRLVLNYAEGKIASVADKISFFKVTKCDRVRKQLNQNEVEAASHTSISKV